MDNRVKKIIGILERVYPDPKPSLRFKTPFESLASTILSAQCTDERVNLVTQKLFGIANTPEKLLNLSGKKLEAYVKPTGFYKAKTKNLLGASKKIISDFGGEVPGTLEELMSLPGVGRKTASVVLAQAFGIPAFPVDRHIFRVAGRLALCNAKTPDKADLELRKTVPEKYWIPMHLQLIYHGRKICRPRPHCPICPLLPHCPDGKIRMKTGAYAK